MASLRGRRRKPDWAVAAPWLAAMLAAGGSAGAQAPARDPWPPGDGVHRSRILVPPLTRFPLRYEGDDGIIVEYPDAEVKR